MNTAVSTEVWLDSPGHARWILDPEVKLIGYGGFVDPGGGSIRVLPIVGSHGTGEPLERCNHPAPGGTLHVGEAGTSRPYLWRDGSDRQLRDNDG